MSVLYLQRKVNTFLLLQMKASGRYTIPEAEEADQEAVVIYIYIQYLRLVKQARGLLLYIYIHNT